MRPALLALLVVASGAAQAQTPSDAQRYGVATLSADGNGCALIRDSEVKIGEKLAIVGGSLRQRIVRAAVASGPVESCKGLPQIWREDGDFIYQLRLTQGGDAVEVGTLMRHPPARLYIRKDGRAAAEERQGAPTLLFRDCTSNEGAHHAVWSGAIGTGQRLWYRYVYAGYDTVPTCTDKD